jgi:small-conductance mechanosensitive channel
MIVNRAGNSSMKNVALAYFALFAYPAVTLLIPDPHLLKWWWRTAGGAPMPKEVKERCKRNQGNLLILKFLALIAVCFGLLKLAGMSPGDIGLRIRQTQGMVVAGILAGGLLICWVWGMRLLSTRMKVPSDGPPHLLKESTPKLLVVMVLGGFAEELWRALSLVAFGRAGASYLFAVLITSITFGVGHVFSYRSLGAAIGRMLAPAIAGACLAALFLWWQTLLVPFIAHVMLNSFGSIMGRKRLIVMTE